MWHHLRLPRYRADIRWACTQLIWTRSPVRYLKLLSRLMFAPRGASQEPLLEREAANGPGLTMLAPIPVILLVVPRPTRQLGPTDCPGRTCSEMPSVGGISSSGSTKEGGELSRPGRTARLPLPKSPTALR